MNKKTVVFDFDGVIHSYTSGWIGDTAIPDPPFPGIREAIVDIRKKYRVVVVSTRCASEEGKAAIKEWLAKYDIVVDDITKEKPPAVVYIDDRAICFDGRPELLRSKIEAFKPWYQAKKDIPSKRKENDMERYISIDNAIKIVTKAMEGGEYKKLIDVSNALYEAPCANVVPKEEADKWYYEYHAIKDALKTEKMYHRETEKLADKYFIECKHLQQMLDAAIAGQESLQRLIIKSEGEWEKRNFIIFDFVKTVYRCTSCNTTWDAPTKFCPNCGAKMKGESNG